MADPFRIHELNPTALPNRLHEVWAARNNVDVRLRIEQILGLIQSSDLAGKMAADAVSFDPGTAGPLSATDVASALDEIAADYLRLSQTTAFSRTLLDDVDAVAARATLAVAGEHIGSYTPSAGMASIDVTGLSAFNILRATGRMVPTTDNSILYAHSSTNNGVSFDAGASDYPTSRFSMVVGSGLSATSAPLPGIALSVTGVGNAAYEWAQFELLMFGFNKNVILDYFVDGVYFDTGGGAVRNLSSGRRAQATARDAIQFKFVGSTIAAGSFVTLEGVRG